MKLVIALLFAAFIVAGISISPAAAESSAATPAAAESPQQITVGGGCFWCMEAIFESFKGVEKVESGYAGGTAENPTYDQVATRETGHAEVIQITFDPEVMPLRKLLTIFFHAHDPTTKDRQGNDVGPEYRSLILYSSEEQRRAAEEVKSGISASGLWDGKEIVTEIAPLKRFYRAEDYHQNYYANNPAQPYCSLVIGPKVQKIRKQFSDLLKRP